MCTALERFQKIAYPGAAVALFQNDSVADMVPPVRHQFGGVIFARPPIGNGMHHGLLAVDAVFF